jgi:hypothetical protein
MFFENQKKNLKIHHNCLQHERVLKIFVLSNFECHQICVNVLMDHCHLSNITKLKKKQHSFGKKSHEFQWNPYKTSVVFLKVKKFHYFRGIFC